MSAAAAEIYPAEAVRRPLDAGAPVTYWRLGETVEARYDVPDQPMSGEMDPFFFLTKHKNFIPHEYPCRTRFAGERREKRPQVAAASRCERVWLPFASPRVDLSGFWFRPTVIGTWAETVIEAEEAGTAIFRLRTCGGAILFVNGSEAGWVAPYGRNLETAEEFSVPLAKGANDIRIWFDDLAERDARYYFQLDYLSGPAASLALPVTIPAQYADAMEAALSAMRFEQPAYMSGEVALVTGNGLPLDVRVEVSVEGDFMSIDEPVRFEHVLAAGHTRIPVADVSELPADFRHFHVTLSAGGYAVTRVFGVEICHADRQGQAPAGLAQRIDEAFREVADYAEADTVRALARLAIGRAGLETEEMISAALPAIEDCHDCADFILVPLLWCRITYGKDLTEALRARIDDAILGYRYWMDEPGNDVQWYFSENHALLFHTAAYLAGDLLPDATFRRSGRRGGEQSATGAARVRAWLDHFEKWEMAEFNSAPYFPIDLKGLCALYALAPDADISTRAGKAILRLLEIVARSAHHGVLTGAQGRSYEHTLRAARSLELSALCRLVWGKGNYGSRFHALPQLALCLRDHGLKVPEELGGIVSIPAGTAQEWCFAQGENAFAKLYHYKTAAYAMGSASAYRWDQWGYQETVLHIRLGHDPDAQIWINHPGEVLQSGYGRPSYWGGCGTIPRVQQYRGLAVIRFACAREQPDFTHAWFPKSRFDAFEIADGMAVAAADGALVLLKTDTGLSEVTSGPTAGNELRAPGRASTWVVRLAAAEEHGSLEVFCNTFKHLTVTEAADGDLVVEDPDFGTVRFHADGRIAAEDRVVDPGTWTIGGHARTFA
ncbi:hypothetical protein [Roseibium marinum]|uniref:Uncharacterized protein n=1 Tax=Roseibium marinum TaxID=281252 RepID=A0A2S3UJT0_9HYPH|nr:hypothetical protein [Roseibium marinum]POF27966.1 hypothetical protein CLV41_11947 [Roseibium marinum]